MYSGIIACDALSVPLKPPTPAEVEALRELAGKLELGKGY